MRRGVGATRSGERLAISEWTLVEFASAAAIKLRMGQATAKLVTQATARMYELAQKHCTIAVLGRDNFRRATELANDDAGVVWPGILLLREELYQRVRKVVHGICGIFSPPGLAG